MQRKIHNQTLFVAALSVYFGLMIIGAPPQALAQQLLPETSESAKPEQKTNSSVAFFLQLNQVLAAEPSKFVPVNFSFKVDVSDKQFINLQILTTAGAERAIEFLREHTVAELKQQNVPQAEFPFQSFLQSFKVNESEIIGELTYTFSHSYKARKFAEDFAFLFENAKSEALKTREKSSLEEITVKHENNQVFIVTRLPRAGLDSLLKADKEANQAKFLF